jgi:hypothetical protein
MVDETNMIVVSAPGYMDVSLLKMISLKDYIKEEFNLTVVGHSPIINIISKSTVRKATRHDIHV